MQLIRSRIFIGFLSLNFFVTAQVVNERDNELDKVNTKIKELEERDTSKIELTLKADIERLTEEIKIEDAKLVIENIALENAEKNLIIEKIYKCDNLINWFTQNLCVQNIKVNFLPIGIANQQWEHGSRFKYFYEHHYLPNERTYLNHKLNKGVYFF